MKIYTNHHDYPIIYGFEIPMRSKWRKEYDWMEQEEFDGAAFVKYRRWLYPISEFMRIDKNAPDGFKGWSGYSSDSFFSGTLIKIDDNDTDYVKMGTYIG